MSDLPSWRIRCWMQLHCQLSQLVKSCSSSCEDLTDLLKEKKENFNAVTATQLYQYAHILFTLQAEC